MNKPIQIILAACLVILVPRLTMAQDNDSTTVFPQDTWDTVQHPDSSRETKTHLTYLVPALEGAGYHVSEGKRQFRHRVSFSPGFGRLGGKDLFAVRFGYSPNSWLGYEISLGHNPASGLHALLHTFSVILRYPLPWRLQPYGTIGYGMMTVFPPFGMVEFAVTMTAKLAAYTPPLAPYGL